LTIRYHGQHDHDILLSKLEFYGIRGKFKEIIKSYRNNRYQRVSITSNNSCLSSSSKWRKVRCGIPQGSILGPLLFLLYINDLARVFGNNHKPVLFADDTSLIFSHLNHTDFSNNITSEFNQLNKWFAAILLSLNLKKLNMYSLTKNIPINKISISYNNMFIMNTWNMEFLGLVIANSLSWKDQLTQLIPKLSKACYVLKSIRPFMSQDALKTVYHSYLHSLISYWNNL
jgi:hypothetical protein